MKLKNYLLPIAASALLLACGYSTEDVTEESEGTLIESISETTGIPESEIEVLEYSLVEAGENKYEGVLKTECRNMTQTFDVIVKVDPKTDEFIVEWELMNEY
jgi:hypothetical protein